MKVAKRRQYGYKKVLEELDHKSAILRGLAQQVSFVSDEVAKLAAKLAKLEEDVAKLAEKLDVLLKKLEVVKGDVEEVRKWCDRQDLLDIELAKKPAGEEELG
ncbi:MAG: hypothetical protein DRO09_00045 [Thermoprotei archaeon]|nr:MAG: hypothetical protein DRO09_00045 [Thermoprotei archaeon]